MMTFFVLIAEVFAKKIIAVKYLQGPVKLLKNVAETVKIVAVAVKKQ